MSYCSLAQLVERVAVNHKADGSIPSRTDLFIALPAISNQHTHLRLRRRMVQFTKKSYKSNFRVFILEPTHNIKKQCA